MSEEEDNEVTALMPTERSLDRLAFEPKTFEQATKMAKIVHDSGLCPKALDTPQKAFVVMMRGRELGLSVWQSFAGIDVIEGKTRLSADLLVALVLRSGEAEYFEMRESTEERATFATRRTAKPGAKAPEEIELAYTIKNAESAKLLGKENWIKNRRAMLEKRAKSQLCRAVYPDICFGLYDFDELDGPVIDVGGGSGSTMPRSNLAQGAAASNVAEKLDLHGDRQDRAFAALREFRNRLGVDRCREVVGRSSADMSIDELEAAVEKLAAYEREHSASDQGSGSATPKTASEAQSHAVPGAASQPLPSGGAPPPLLESVSPTSNAQPGPAAKQEPGSSVRKPADDNRARTTPDAPREPAQVSRGIGSPEGASTASEVLRVAASKGFSSRLRAIAAETFGGRDDLRKLSPAELYRLRRILEGHEPGAKSVASNDRGGGR